MFTMVLSPKLRCSYLAGNGTEDIVRRYQHPSRLFFFSVHLYDKEDPPSTFEFFPGSGRDDDTVSALILSPL